MTNQVALRHLRKLDKARYDIWIPDEHDVNTFFVYVRAPSRSAYCGGVWDVRVELPRDYPFEPPAIYFTNKIFHPNISPLDGRLHLDVLGNSWRSTSDLNIIFDTIIPGILYRPDYSDAYNLEAVALWIRNRRAYFFTARVYTYAYAIWPYVVVAAQEPMLDDNDAGGNPEDIQIAPEETGVDEAAANP